ncbi:gem-associated protein 4 [Pholidichthys leucotaenia]
MALMMDKDSAVIEGAFLLADKLCQPSSLSSIQKADWSRCGRPVLEALGEICRQEEPSVCSISKAASWKKKIVCVVWLKLLSREANEDVEAAWRENPFFSVQNCLPEVNSVVLLELVKTTTAVGIFASLLQCLPQPQICLELERLTEHIRSDPMDKHDVQLFLEVWWELWKGRPAQEKGAKESIELMFADQFVRLSSKSSSLSPQAAKRLKLDTTDSPHADVLHILLCGLKDMKAQVSSTELCFQALSTSLDALYTSFLIDQEVILSIKEKLNLLCKLISTKEKNEESLTPELIREAQRDLQASHTPSQFQPSCMKLNEALDIISELAQFWQNSGLLTIPDDANLTYSIFKLEQSIQRVLAALDKAPEAVSNMDDGKKDILRGLMQSLVFPDTDSTHAFKTKVVATIITHHLDDYENFARLFASEMSWVDCGELWLDCVEKNQAAFQQHGPLLSLSRTLISKLQKESPDVSQCRKLLKIIVDIFSALSLEDKNKGLAAILRLSSRGFFESSVSSAMSGRFEQELNMAFNCIIQGGAGASQGSLKTAASLVARVAFQNPEATLRSCCNSAVNNKGAFSLMAEILQLLPGLRGQRGREASQSDDEESVGEGTGVTSGSRLMCRCLQEMIRTKSLAPDEKEQLLKFLSLLITPVIRAEEEGKKSGFLTPQEVVKALVLPNLSPSADGSTDVELSLQILHTALSADVLPAASSPHWVMDCSPFPLLYFLAQLLNQTLRCWEQPAESDIHLLSMDTKELLMSVLITLSQVAGADVAANPSSWSRPLFWLYNKMEELDWTVRFHLKPVWGEHFKNEVPSSLLAVCDLIEQEWSGLDLPLYGQGTGLLAWMECCSISDSLQSTMLSCLSLDQCNSEHVIMFSKGLLVALTQTLPWCSVSQWTRLLRALRKLISSGRLHVPFSLEYVDYLPLLDLRRFSCELRLSVLLLRVFQLLCGTSCSSWLPASGWAHVGRLYALAVRDVLSSVKSELPLPSSAGLTMTASMSPKAPTSKDSHLPNTSPKPGNMSTDPLKEAGDCPLKSEETVPSKEVLFVLSQLFCHVQHVQVMIPSGQCEPLFLSSLEILSHYEAIMAAFPDSCSSLESDNTRHFFTTITDNLESTDMKAVLQQKISQLVSSAS